MVNAIFIVWRESIEAMLVIGVLFAWLTRNDRAGNGLRALGGGVATGVALAAALGWTILAAQNELADAALEWLQANMLLFAAILIVQMVLWIDKHGRQIKKDLERARSVVPARSGTFAIAAVAARVNGRKP